MSKPSVLIVGAGAVGLAVGYHLSLAGADITFLVRPGRSSACASPQQLYCYDDAELKTFAGYHVVESIAELTEMPFQFVIVTLDGHSSFTEEGTALLRNLGDAIRTSEATVIMSGVALGLREHYLQSMRIPRSVAERITRHAQPSGQRHLIRPCANRPGPGGPGQHQL